MLRLSRAVLSVAALLAGCAKAVPRPALVQAETTTVAVPAAPDAGLSPPLAPSAPVPEVDPLSLEPRSNPDARSECRGSCGGKVGAALEKDLFERAKKTRACYNRALAVDPTLQGRLVIELRINKDGAVCAATLLRNELLTSNVSECALSVMTSASYTPPDGANDCAVVKVPISFVRQSDAGAPP